GTRRRIPVARSPERNFDRVGDFGTTLVFSHGLGELVMEGAVSLWRPPGDQRQHVGKSLSSGARHIPPRNDRQRLIPH
ncbi:MAG: hypothetical protein ACKN9U_16220, partial [Pirellulaceae bacterium]